MADVSVVNYKTITTFGADPIDIQRVNLELLREEEAGDIWTVY